MRRRSRSRSATRALARVATRPSSTSTSGSCGALPRLKHTNFKIGSPQEKGVQKKAVDTTIAIEFKEGNKKLPLKRDELLALLFNVESQSPVWKLRSLAIRNVDTQGTRGGREPKVTLEDKWVVQQMIFVSRRPNAPRSKASRSAGR